MKIQLAKDPDGGGKPQSDKDRIEQLESELAIANQTIATLQLEKAQLDADEKVIREKMALGLTRDQAIAVIGRQKKHDEDVAAKAKASK